MHNLDERSKNILKIILIGLGVFFTFWYLREILDFLGKFIRIIQPFIMGFMLAYIINIPMNFFYRLIRENYKDPKQENVIRGVSLVLSWICVLLFVTLLLNIFIPQIIKSALTLSRKWPLFVDETYKILKNNSLTENYANDFREITKDVNWLSVNGPIFKYINTNSKSLLTMTSSIINSIGSSAITIFTVVVFSIFVLIYKDMLKLNGNKLLYAFLDEKDADYVNKVFSLSYHTFKDYIYSRMISVALLIVLTYIGMVIFSIPNAPMISILVGLSDLIPIFGPIAGAGISAVIIFIESPIKALIFLIYDVIMQQVQENVIYPAIANAQVGLPAVWVLASVTIGGSLFGIVGMLVSIPVASVLYTLAHEKVEQRLMKKGFNQKDIMDKQKKNFIQGYKDEAKK